MSANLTLPISMLVNVGIDFRPVYSGTNDFNRLCIVGSSANTRGTASGIYTNLVGVGQHYDDDTNEYKVAQQFFNQIPKPKSVMIATVENIAYPVSE